MSYEFKRYQDENGKERCMEEELNAAHLWQAN